ncbi:hypothetical protein [Mycolicibacterium celeriflavum]|nr:hypothetical protein [Mycolicibacterium celeriflavum]MCV7240410.1 hypothetical protein [Mycolicibacterium celeriflavum]
MAIGHIGELTRCRSNPVAVAGWQRGHEAGTMVMCRRADEALDAKRL